ncbi:unnamed protein product [Durusdinium trenchii]|uniref:Prenylcysteine lyase domain-containing protein n=1 Tax=Durusdinium trenchii TaxID=1381693 RepID=A0ABP0HMA8_9DINO
MAKQIGTIALSNGVRYSDALIAGLSEKLTIARKYQQIFATFFRVPPTSSSLACTDPPGGTILSTAGGNFNSLGQYDTTSGSGPQIWKSFSNSPLDVDSEKALFPEKPQETYAWWAYPVYDTEDERGREIPFCLDDHGLFYCNAIEAAASAMEMAVIGAKNCVLLAKNRLKGLTEKIDKTRSKL